MKNSTRTFFVLVVGLALFAADLYAADEKPKPRKVFTDADVEVAWQRRIHDIYIDNWPLAEVANFLGRQFPELNFVVPESARAETVPILNLRNVTLGEIFKSIEIASGGRIRGGVPTEQMGMDAKTGLPFRQTADNAQGNMVTFNVGPLAGSQAADRQASQNAENSDQPVCRVFSLAPYLAYKSEKDADAAINSLYEALAIAWNMLGKQVRHVAQPDLKIHSGTKLLIAVGRERELAVIEQVIKELQGSAPTRRITAPAENESKPKAATTDAPPAASPKQ